MIFDGLGSGLRNAALAAALVSVVLLVAWLWWFGFAWLPLAVYAVIATLATLSVPLMHRLTGHTLAEEMQWLEERESIEHDEMIARLAAVRRELDDLGVDDGARQADTLTGILEDYHAVVRTRFVGKKHAPLEYLATARRVQKQALQNLNDAVATVHSLGTLSHQSHEAGDDERSQRRDAQRRSQQQRLDDLFDENRTLFAALTDTAVEVANIPSMSQFERLDTLARLTSLAEIANQTGR